MFTWQFFFTWVLDVLVLCLHSSTIVASSLVNIATYSPRKAALTWSWWFFMQLDICYVCRYAHCIQGWLCLHDFAITVHPIYFEHGILNPVPLHVVIMTPLPFARQLRCSRKWIPRLITSDATRQRAEATLRRKWGLQFIGGSRRIAVPPNTGTFIGYAVVVCFIC